MKQIGLVLRLGMLLLLAGGMARLGIVMAQQAAPGRQMATQSGEAPRYAEAWHLDHTAMVQEGIFHDMVWEEGRGFIPTVENAPAGTLGHYLSPVLATTRPARAAVVEWQLEEDGESQEGADGAAHAGHEHDTGVSLALRWQVGGEWSQWVDFSEDREMPAPDVHFSAPLLLPGAEALQLRVQVEPGRVVRRVTLGTMELPDGEDAAVLAVKAVPLPGGGPLVIPRHEWGPNQGAVRWAPEPSHPRAVVIHHTATGTGGEDPASVVRAIDTFHRVTRGWGDIGYHYLIDHHGRIYEGRKGGAESVGAHAYNFNQDTVGIALVGTFESASISYEARRSLVSLISWLSRRYEMNPHGHTRFYNRNYPTIMGHRDTGRATSCPGGRTWEEIGQLRQMVAQELAGVPPMVPPGIELAPPATWSRGQITVTVQSSQSASHRLTLQLDGQEIQVSDRSFDLVIDTTTLTDGEHLLVATDSRGDETVASERLLQVDNSPPLLEVGEPGTAEEASLLASDEGSGLASASLRRRDDAGQWGEWEPIEGPFPAPRFEQKVAFQGAAALQWRLSDRAGNEIESKIVERPQASTPTPPPTETVPVPTSTPTEAPVAGTPTPGSGVIGTPLQLEAIELFPTTPIAGEYTVLQVLAVNRSERATEGEQVITLLIDGSKRVRWRVEPGMPAGAFLLLRSDRELLPDSSFGGQLPAGTYQVEAVVEGRESESRFGPVTVTVKPQPPSPWERWLQEIGKLLGE